MKVYIDKDFKCHASNDGTMTPVDSEFFDGKCAAFIEGYCYEEVDGCVKIYPWKNDAELDEAQREYERERLADAENALAIMFGGESV